MITYSISANLRARVNTKPKLGQKLLVVIPGGPGISGRYMDASSRYIAQALNSNLALLDLPNHDTSRSAHNSPIENYSSARAEIRTAFQHFADLGCQILVLGHSLGGVIGLDIFQDFNESISKIVLVSMPICWKENPSFRHFLRDHNAEQDSWDTEQGFAEWWAKIIPAYFKGKPSLADLKVLTAETFWKENAQFMVGMPTAFKIFNDLSVDSLRKIFYLEGEEEIILPANNFDEVKIAMLPSRSIKLLGSGHFPMLEQQDMYQKKVLDILLSSEDTSSK